MEYSKQRLLLALMVEFNVSFNKQINESVINQEIGQFIKDSVQELSDKQYRGSLFDQKIDFITNKVNQAKADDNLMFNDYTGRLWDAILQIVKRTTSFETAYSLIDILGSKNTSLKL